MAYRKLNSSSWRFSACSGFQQHTRTMEIGGNLRSTPCMDVRVLDVKLRYKNVNAGRDYHGCQDTIISRFVRRLVSILPIEEQK